MLDNNKKIKVGLIVTMSEDVWPEDFVSLVASFIKPAKELIEQLGFDVVTTNNLCRSISDARKQGCFLRNQGIDVLVNHVGTWTYANDSVAVSQIVNVPVIIWPSYSKDSLGIAGGAIVRGSHDELNIKNYMVYGDYDDVKLKSELSVLIKGIAGATKLKGLKLGVGGTRSMGMIASQPDPNALLRDIQIDVDGFEQIILVEKAKKYPQAEVEAFYKWLEKEYKSIDVSKEVMDAQIRMYFALRDCIIEKDYDFVAVKCLPELPYVYTTFCLAHSLLNNKSDDGFGVKAPFVASCEADINAALTMQILKNITNDFTLFTDILYMDYEKHIATFGNCGSQPTDFAKSRKNVCWVHEGFIGHDFVLGCACPRYIGKEGVATISRLTRINGKYSMLITKGDFLHIKMPEEEEIGSKQHPKLFFKPHCDERSFVESLRTNHLHAVYGDFTKELEIACDVLGFNKIIP
jgi:L-fucose/D-arabinose isomerase